MESFNKGFAATLQYKKQYGNANVPSRYKTSDGLKHGSWQDRQKVAYKNGKLVQVRIKKLEELGFVWRRVPC